MLVRYVVVRFLRRYLLRSDIYRVFVSFVTGIVTVLGTLLVATIALDALGVSTGPLLSVLVGAILAVVAAMQGWLQDVAGGLWMLLNRPFKLDDQVKIAEVEGRVQETGFLTTTLRTGDNLTLILHNRTVASSTITNFHAQPERRINLEVEIGYDDDIRQAVDVIRDVLASDERVLAEPEPVIAVADLGPNGTKLHVRPWTKQEHFSDTRYDLREKMKYAFDANGLTIAYPRLEVRMDGNGSFSQ